MPPPKDRRDIKIVINAQRRPAHEHERRFNLPETGEVALLIPDEPHGVRDIVLHHREGHLERISENHRSYDQLYYVLHPQDSEGWSLEMKRQLHITAT